MSSRAIRERQSPTITGNGLPSVTGGIIPAASSSVKDRARGSVYARAADLVKLAHDIHERPELAYAEGFAANRLAEFLEQEGFAVRRGVCEMPTAFVATVGHGPLHIAFCAEYDALPPACLFDRSKPPDLKEVWLTPERKDAPLSHACGHHLIAGAAVSAALGLRDLADEAELTVSVFGTPAEELVGLPEPPEGFMAAGKIALLQRGAFDGVHAALMVHPGATPWSMFIPTHVYIRQRACFSPSAGNGHSLGMAELQQLRDTLKQAVRALHLIPALFVARPGDQNVPAQADLLWIGKSEAEASRARGVVRRCFDEAASAAGTTVQVSEFAPGVDLRNDPLLSASFRRNSEVLGRVRFKDERIQAEIRRVFADPRIPLMARTVARLLPRLVSPPGLFLDRVPVEIVYGTDLANVSRIIPSIHPMIGIGGTSGPHAPEFAADADTDEAYRAMLDGGIALAWTALDGATEPNLRRHLYDSNPKPNL